MGAGVSSVCWKGALVDAWLDVGGSDSVKVGLGANGFAPGVDWSAWFQPASRSAAGEFGMSPSCTTPSAAIKASRSDALLLDARAEHTTHELTHARLRDHDALLDEVTLERGAELIGRLVTGADVSAERLLHDVGELFRVLRVKLARIRYLPGGHQLQRVSRVFSAEQALARRELEEHDSEREDVAPAIDLLCLRLLGRHVGELALDRVVVAELAVHRGVRDAEVHELRLTVETHQDVVGEMSQ